MTDEIKNKIIALRKEGYGYKKIAKETGETIGVVRHLCVALEHKETTECLQCGLPIKSPNGRKQKRFCSDRCRWNYWNKRKKLENRKTFHEVVCKQCGKTFMAYGNARRSFCSQECYQKSRHKEVQIDGSK